MSSCAYHLRHPIAGILIPLPPEVKAQKGTCTHVLTPTLSQGHPEDPLTNAQEHVNVESHA